MFYIVLAYNQAKNKSSIYIKMIALLLSEFNDAFFRTKIVTVQRLAGHEKTDGVD